MKKVSEDYNPYEMEFDVNFDSISVLFDSSKADIDDVMNQIREHAEKHNVIVDRYNIRELVLRILGIRDLAGAERIVNEGHYGFSLSLSDERLVASMETENDKIIALSFFPRED